MQPESVPHSKMPAAAGRHQLFIRMAVIVRIIAARIPPDKSAQTHLRLDFRISL